MIIRIVMASVVFASLPVHADPANDVRCQEIAFSQSVENKDPIAFESFIDADGNAVEHWGTFNSIWRKQEDDTWKVVFDAGNAAAEAPSAEVQALLDAEPLCD
jgi:hypothetical protein